MRPSKSILLSVMLLASVSTALGQSLPPYPPTRVEVVNDVLHGQTIADPYRWLEDKDSPETKDWVREQMAYTQGLLGQVPDRAFVTETMMRLAKVDSQGLPTQRGERLFYMKRTGSQQQSVLFVRDGARGSERVLIDPATLDSTFKTSITLLDVSLDGRIAIYGIRRGGEDEVEPHFLDVVSGREVAPPMPRARYIGLQLDRTAKTLWYSRWEAKGPRVWVRALSQSAEHEKMAFGEGLTQGNIPVFSLSQERDWALITVLKGSTSNGARLHLARADRPEQFVSLNESLETELSAQIAGGRLYVKTTWNSPNGRLMVADVSKPLSQDWREVVAERNDAKLEGASLVGGRICATYLKNVVSELVVHDLKGARLRGVALPGLGSASTPVGRLDSKDAYFTFSSFNRPPTSYRLDVRSGETTEWFRSNAAFDPNRFEVRQVSAQSKDGTRVPFFMVHKKGLAMDGANPTLLHGYGGFAVAQVPRFSSYWATWLELGGVLVLANLRGGDEFGEPWHQAAMLEKKQNSFDDFHAVATWLVTHGVCRPQRLAIQGGSNGGLLVGAAMTQRPELHGSVLCTVPLLDMVRYHQFLVARFWVPEYGSSEDPKQFEFLRAYSPYHQVKQGTPYPSVMFVTGDSDTRVDPLHARKMAALMQSVGGERPALLHYDSAAGHSGGKPLDRGIADSVDQIQFLRWTLGVAPIGRD